jgi:hypothetical protein
LKENPVSVGESKHDGSLVYDGLLPFSVQILDAMPSDNTLAMVNDKNEHSLRSSLVGNDNFDLEEHDELGHYLKRQEAKIDLLLDMVTELLTQQKRLPEERQLRLTPQGLQWQQCDANLPADAWVEVLLYLTPSLPRPLRFFGTVNSNAETHSVNFIAVSQPVTELMEKLLFRHHRRAVAQQRQSR